MKNKEIADILFSFADYLEMREVSFKPRAYEKAAHAVESLEEPIENLYREGGIARLEEIPGVGKNIALKIEEYLHTGKVKEFEMLRKKMPVDLRELRRIEGLGPKSIKVLYEKLRVKDIPSLKRAAQAGKIRALGRFGKRSEEKILKGIEFYEGASARLPIGEVLPLARSIVERLARLPEARRVEYTGSLRRWQETIGDIDILVTAKNARPITEAFVALPEVQHVHALGQTKSSVRLRQGLDADLRVMPEESFGAALLYFTGSKDHNVLLRKVAASKGLKLNEYGLYRGTRPIAGKTEESVYKALGVPTPIPELRQGKDELEKVYHNVLKLEDLRGDLQVQTDWTDGAASIEEMARAACALGREYIAITDHTRSLAMTGGSDEKKLRRQIAAIDVLNKKSAFGAKFTILKGAEVNILPSGLLDVDDATLERLDVVGAAVHSNFALSAREQTDRIIRAMENPHVDIIFHPTGRVLGKRPPFAVFFKELAEAARRTETILEIDAHPYRLDLRDEHIREAAEYGVFFAIDSDAHNPADLGFLEYGVGQARRAGLTQTRVVNTLPVSEIKKLFSTPKTKRFHAKSKSKS